jgi:hypothetical protein
METRRQLKNKTNYYCNVCHYSTLSHKDFNKHELTTKHIGNISGNNKKSPPNNTISANHNNNSSHNYADLEGEKSQINQEKRIFICSGCNNEYKSRGGIWKHRKTCVSDVSSNVICNTICNTTEKRSQKNDEGFTTEMIIDLLKQNKELQAVLIEQNTAFMEQTNKIFDISNRQPTIVQNTSTTNNQFNLNFFLNEQCKNAINIQDFLDNIQLTVADIEATGRLGYVNGISRIFINKLKEMDIFTRPLHCTDLKRETVYIRDNNTWEKEKDEQPKLKKLVKIMARKNLKQLPAWQEKNPEYVINNSAQNEAFTQLSLTCLGAFTEEEDERDTQKILRNVLKEIRVDRN